MLTDDFARLLFDLTDVNKHSVARIDRPGENKVRHVITASAVTRPGFRTKSGEIFPVAPMLDLQAPRCRELETFADRQQHEAANTLEMVSQIAPAIFLECADMSALSTATIRRRAPNSKNRPAREHGRS